MDELNQNAYEYCHQCGMGVQELREGLCLPCDEQNNDGGEDKTPTLRSE